MLGGGVALFATAPRKFGARLLLRAYTYEAQGIRTHVYASDDGGATWRHLRSATAGPPFVLVSATRWLQIGPGGGSRETTDAGVSWHDYASNYGQAAGVAPDVVFGSAQVGYATVRGSIQRTVDGGAHWGYLTTPGTQ
jgi:photosystem II stability/assembly factor-like uncharacterized protein